MTDEQARSRIIELLETDADFREKFADQAIEDWDSVCYEGGYSKLTGAAELFGWIEAKL